MNQTAETEAPLQAVLSDASRRTGVALAALKVVGVERVTWPDGSLGCPAPDRLYTQALVPGYRIRIDANGDLLDYHASLHGAPSQCPPGRVRPPLNDKARM